MRMFKSEMRVQDVADPLLSRVIAEGPIVIQLDYPLVGQFRWTRRRDRWTGADLVNEVREIYQKSIYSSDKSEKQYGVWGHNIGDLVVEGFQVRNRAGKLPLVTFAIGS